MSPSQLNVRGHVFGIELDGFLQLRDPFRITLFIDQTPSFEDEPFCILWRRHQDDISLCACLTRFSAEQVQFSQLELGVSVRLVQLRCSNQFGECVLKMCCTTQLDVCQGQAVMGIGIVRVELHNVHEFNQGLVVLLLIEVRLALLEMFRLLRFGRGPLTAAQDKGDQYAE